jgi:type IV pilus assembly protein PilW
MRSRRIRAQSGFSLVELTIVLGVSLVLLAVLTVVFVKSSQTRLEQEKSAEQIMKGRYAMEIISEDLRLAGFYGEFSNLPPRLLAQMPYPPTLPDPCDINPANLLKALPYAVQGYAAGNPRPPCLAAANHLPGTDVLVIRRAATTLLAPGSRATANDFYLQANAATAEIQRPATAVLLPNPNNPGRKADGSSATAIFKKDGATGADVRKYHVHIYFIAPCSVPANGELDCNSSADDNGHPIPTLKRLELGPGGFTIVSLVEGIANLQIDYGLDENPASVDPSTQYPGDGSADRFVKDPARAPPPATPTFSNWENVVSAKVYILARNTKDSPGYIDGKSYTMGLAGYAPAANDAYRRHLHSALVRLTNPSSRREIPCVPPCL